MRGVRGWVGGYVDERAICPSVGKSKLAVLANKLSLASGWWKRVYEHQAPVKGACPDRQRLKEHRP